MGGARIIVLIRLLLLSYQEFLHLAVPESIEGFGGGGAKDTHEGYELGGRQTCQLTLLKGAKRVALKPLAILTYSDLMPFASMNAPTALPMALTISGAKLPTTFFVILAVDLG